MITKLLYVEDGSVDLEELKIGLPETVKIIVYRQGASHPELVEIKQEDTQNDR